MKERDDVCEWCGGDLVWQGSLMDGGLVCPDCMGSVNGIDVGYDDADDKISLYQTSGNCPECGLHSKTPSGAHIGALVCQNMRCDVVAFRFSMILSRRGMVVAPKQI